MRGWKFATLELLLRRKDLPVRYLTDAIDKAGTGFEVPGTPIGGLRPPIHHGSKRWFVVHEP